MRCASVRLRASFCVALALSCSGAGEGGDLQVHGSEPEDYVGTQDEVESNLTDELAIKLRQFDEWTHERERQAAAEARQRQAAAEQAAADAAAGHGAASANTGSPAGQAAADAGQAEGADTATHTNVQDAEATSQVGSIGQTGLGAVSGSQSSPVGGPRSRPTKIDKAKVEDDVARMIREAAEQETDPARRKALMVQYDAYVRNL